MMHNTKKAKPHSGKNVAFRKRVRHGNRARCYHIERIQHQFCERVALSKTGIEILAAKIFRLEIGVEGGSFLAAKKTVHTLHKEIFYTNVMLLSEKRGWTKDQLSEISGVSVSFISDITNGRGNPSLRTMEKLAIALETPLTILLESTDLDADTLGDTKGLPEGFERVTLVLSDQHAFQAKKWAKEDAKKRPRK